MEYKEGTHKLPVKKMIIWGVVFLAIGLLFSYLTMNSNSLVAGAFVGLMGWVFIILEIIAIVFAVMNKKTEYPNGSLIIMNLLNSIRILRLFSSSYEPCRVK